MARKHMLSLVMVVISFMFVSTEIAASEVLLGSNLSSLQSTHINSRHSKKLESSAYQSVQLRIRSQEKVGLPNPWLVNIEETTEISFCVSVESNDAHFSFSVLNKHPEKYNVFLPNSPSVKAVDDACKDHDNVQMLVKRRIENTDSVDSLTLLIAPE